MVTDGLLCRGQKVQLNVWKVVCHAVQRPVIKQKKYVTVLSAHHFVKLPKPSTKAVNCHTALGCIRVFYPDFGNRVGAKTTWLFRHAQKSSSTLGETSASVVIAIVRILSLFFRPAMLARYLKFEDAVHYK